MKTQCSLEISRVQNNDGTEIMVTVSEEKSRVQLVRGFMSLEDFAKIITGQGDVKFNCELNLENVGKTREFKHEMVPNKGCYSNEALKEIWNFVVKPFEVDGWKGSLYDYLNGKNRTSEATKVRFERWI